MPITRKNSWALPLVLSTRSFRRVVIDLRFFSTACRRRGDEIFKVGGLRQGAREFEPMPIGFFLSLLVSVRFSSLDGEVS